MSTIALALCAALLPGSAAAQEVPPPWYRFLDLDLGLGIASGTSQTYSVPALLSNGDVARGIGFGLRAGIAYGSRSVRLGARYEMDTWSVDDQLTLRSSFGPSGLAFGAAGVEASAWSLAFVARFIPAQVGVFSLELGLRLGARSLNVGIPNTPGIDWFGPHLGADLGVMFRVFQVSDWMSLHVGPSFSADATLFPSPQKSISIQSQQVTGSDFIDARFSAMLVGRVSFGVAREPPPPPPPPVPVTEYVLVRARTTADAVNRQVPFVLDTPAHRRMLPGVRTVALRAPGRCEDVTPTTLRGVVSPSSEILRSICATEMSVIEERLIRQGLRVISWTQFHGTAQDAIATARRLGAQVMFQVHSLERTRGSLDLDFERRVEYFRSNVHGVAGDPLPLRSIDRAALRRLLSVRGASVASDDRVGASLELSAHEVSNGELVWTFRWNHLLAGHGEETGVILARRVDGGPWEAVPLPSEVRGAVRRTGDELLSEEVERGHRDFVAANPGRVAEHQLVEEVVDRAVNSYLPTRAVESHARRDDADPPAPVPEPAAAPAVASVPAAPAVVVATPPIPVDVEEPSRRRHRRRR